MLGLHTIFSSMFSGSGAAHSIKDAGILWSLLMVFSFLVQGADTVMKVCRSFSNYITNYKILGSSLTVNFYILVGSHLSR